MIRSSWDFKELVEDLRTNAKQTQEDILRELAEEALKRKSKNAEANLE